MDRGGLRVIQGCAWICSICASQSARSASGCWGCRGGGAAHGDALLGVDFEHAANEVLGVRRELGGHGELADLDFGEEMTNVLVVEGEATGEERKEDDTAGPNVGGRAVVVETLLELVRSAQSPRRGTETTHSDNLGRSVVRRSTARLQQLSTALEGGHSKVGDLDVLLAVEEEVLGFEIAMANVEAMTVVHSRDDLLEVVQRLVGVKTTARDEVVEQLAAFDVLHDEVAVGFGIVSQDIGRGVKARKGSLQVVSGLPNIHEPKDVGVLDELHDDNLALDSEKHLFDGSRVSSGTIAYDASTLQNTKNEPCRPSRWGWLLEDEVWAQSSQQHTDA